MFKSIALAFISLSLIGTTFAADKPMKHDGIMMKNGKTMVMKDGKTMAMDKEMTLDNGTKVMIDGTVMMKDGTKSMLKDGDMIHMDGKMMKKADKKKDASK